MKWMAPHRGKVTVSIQSLASLARVSGAPPAWPSSRSEVEVALAGVGAGGAEAEATVSSLICRSAKKKKSGVS